MIGVKRELLGYGNLENGEHRPSRMNVGNHFSFIVKNWSWLGCDCLRH